MRRKDREVTDSKKIEEILEACDCCRIGLVDGAEAYIVPLNFGYERIDGRFILYFHCAKEGRKIDLLPRQESVSFEMDRKHSLVEGETGCDFSYRYQCIMGKSVNAVEFAKMAEQSGAAAVAVHGRTREQFYSGKADWEFRPEVTARVQVLKLSVTEMSCKES